MKKWLSFVGIVFLLVVSVRPIGNALVTFSINNQGKSWAPTLAFQSCHTMYWLGNNADTSAALEKCIGTFPESEYVPSAYFWNAHCQEKERNFATARDWYQALVDRYPDHPLATTAKNRISEMVALGHL